MIRIHQEQARRFLLRKNGLLGPVAFRGKEGVRAYIGQAGCVQFDPIDVCGRSHELALLARVKGFSRDLLYDLLYRDRTLIDYFDKNMCILCVEDWPSLGFLREHFRLHTRSREAVEGVAGPLMRRIHEAGCLSSKELDMQEKVDWPWGETTLGRAALETLYFRGDLVIHHKTGAVKSYALAADCLPADLLETPSPFENDAERQMWQVMRRIGAVGLLWNAPSDAWLGVAGLNARSRGAAFDSLVRLGVIAPVEVEGLRLPLFALAEDLPLLRACREPVLEERQVRLLPPLDCMLWDRRLIDELFGFSYKWEVYTPKEQRRYGYYVLPVLYGEEFAGRVEPVADRDADALVVRAFWPEAGVHGTSRLLWALEDELGRLRRFLGLGKLVWQEGWLREP